MTTETLILSELTAQSALDTIEAQAKTIAERDAEIARLREALAEAFEEAASIAANFGPSRPIVTKNPTERIYGRWEGEQAASASINDLIRARARAAIAAYERAMWRPIDEAPRNKMVLLAWRNWRTTEWENEVNHASTGKRHESGYSSISWHGEATHFRPLPAPPEDAA